jgi:ankyrin repeat protein
MEMPPARESQALSLLREFLKVHRKGKPFHTGYHALPRAAREGKLGHVKEMLNHDPELVDKKHLPASGYQPPLHEAVKAGKEEVVKELCAPRSYTLSLDQRDHRGNTALHQAILSNQIAMISLLIEKGADKELPSGQTEGLLPPLHLASREQNLLAVKALLRKGVDGKRRVTNVPLCDKCRTMKILPNGGNARCVLRNLDSSLRRANFQELNHVLFTARRA